MAKLRLSYHQLCIEPGRQRGLERAERKCVLCDLNDIEDEYHFVCICPVYYNLRRQYLHFKVFLCENKRIKIYSITKFVKIESVK